MLRAAWRQILDEACEEKGNLTDGLEETDEQFELSGDDGMSSIRQQAGAVDGPLSGSRSQWRLRKMGMSWNAQKRCVLILALSLLTSFLKHRLERFTSVA